MHEPYNNESKNAHSRTIPKGLISSVSLTTSSKSTLFKSKPLTKLDSQSIHSFLNHGKDLSETSTIDLKTCEITPGQETLIEIRKEKMGLGLSIVGGSDTPLVGHCLNLSTNKTLHNVNALN